MAARAGLTSVTNSSPRRVVGLRWNSLQLFRHRRHRCLVTILGPEQPAPATVAEDEATSGFASYQRERSLDALGRVYELLAPYLLRVARGIVGDSYLAEDVVQSAFIEVIGQADRFDCERTIRPWLRSIVEHRARDLRRSRRRLRSGVSFDLDQAEDAGPRERCEHQEVIQSIDSALADLPQRCACVVHLHYWSGWTARQIAANKRLPLGTVKSRIRRGLALLRGRLDG